MPIIIPVRMPSKFGRDVYLGFVVISYVMNFYLCLQVGGVNKAMDIKARDGHLSNRVMAVAAVMVVWVVEAVMVEAAIKTNINFNFKLYFETFIWLTSKLKWLLAIPFVKDD